jgi:hypothetical protein
MNYQELYAKYQTAVKLRELNIDSNYLLLKEIFRDKMLANISLNANTNIIHYLSGIKEVFTFVDNESEKVPYYRDELDKVFGE